MPYYPLTLDVERARWWLTKNHPTRECRDLAELLHDYSLTVLQPKPVDPRRKKILSALSLHGYFRDSEAMADTIINELNR